MQDVCETGTHGALLEFQSDSNFSYYRARYYDTTVGRFVSEDPARFKSGETNMYPYVANRPIANVDPRGLTSWPIIGGLCCNNTPMVEWWMDEGKWKRLLPGQCTGLLEDCDGMTCGGGFYVISNFEYGICNTPGTDCKKAGKRRWTPGHRGPNAKSPSERGGPPTTDDPPPGYSWRPVMG
jgi:RHS repeat-associated protein